VIDLELADKLLKKMGYVSPCTGCTNKWQICLACHRGNQNNAELPKVK